ncbi:cupin domain-containing protein [Lactobacillus amylovorus]|uniref:cupin domain-containing protein n=1 Tax=Lactobacillus amylovorus TaxID=1604 RepID=UPI00313C8564|nr:cupin domain-containing protein [Lactobacillus amylovorus]
MKIVKHNRYTTPLTHNHDFYEMFYVLEGEFTQSIGNQRFLMQTGDVLFITHFM